MEQNGEKSAAETLAALVGDWRRLFTRCVEEAEQFTREKPSAGLAVAFLAGLVAGSLLRKR